MVRLHCVMASGLGAAALSATAGQAQDFYVYAGAAIEYERDPDGQGTDDTRDINA